MWSNPPNVSSQVLQVMYKITAFNVQQITLKPKGFQVQQIGKQMWGSQYAHKNTQI